MSMKIVQFSLAAWRTKMWETALESAGNKEKMLHLLSEKWVLHIGLIRVKPEYSRSLAG